MDKRYTNIDYRTIELMINYPIPKSLIDNISDEMLQEMIDCDELQFEHPLDLSNRDIKHLVCRCFILRTAALKLWNCAELYELLRLLFNLNERQ